MHVYLHPGSSILKFIRRSEAVCGESHRHVLVCAVQNQEAILVLQKRIYQIQTDLGTAQTQFAETTEKLDTTSKSLTAVSCSLHLEPIRPGNPFTERSDTPCTVTVCDRHTRGFDTHWRLHAFPLTLEQL